MPGDTQVTALADAPRSTDDEAEWEIEYQQRLFDWAVPRVQAEFRVSTWLAFWQTAVEQRPVGEVAAELQLSPGAVYIARSRVIARLREEIESAGGEGCLPT